MIAVIKLAAVISSTGLIKYNIGRHYRGTEANSVLGFAIVRGTNVAKILTRQHVYALAVTVHITSRCRISTIPFRKYKTIATYATKELLGALPQA